VHPRPNLRSAVAGHDLLGQNIERFFRNDHSCPTRLLANTAEQGGAFGQFIACQWENAPFGNASVSMLCSPDTLQQNGDGPGRTKLADQVDRRLCRSPIPAKQSPQALSALTFFKPILRVEAEFGGKTAMMGSDFVLDPNGRKDDA
jgi:hypothetical protein